MRYAVVLVLVLVLGCGSGSGGERPVPPQRQVGREEPAKPALPPEPSWAPSNQAVRNGDLQVKITKAFIGKVPLKTILGKHATSEADLLLLKLELMNATPTKKIEYSAWAGKGVAFDRDYATLTDNFGNSYKRIDFGLGSYPLGSVEGSEAIYPNKSITDLLVFEVPVDAATHLDLELPARNYGGEGTVRFRIPTKSIFRESLAVGHRSPARQGAKKEDNTTGLEGLFPDPAPRPPVSPD